MTYAILGANGRFGFGKKAPTGDPPYKYTKRPSS